MNERIKELWEKAAESTAAYPSGQNNSWETQVNFLDNFAQLIIKECIGICNRRGEVLQNHLDERGKNMAEEPYVFTEGAISASFRNAQSIRQHFGVEE